MVADGEKRRFAEFERAGWEEVAAGYAQASDGSTTQVCQPLLDAAEVRAGDRVLDVATGPGWTAAAAAARGAAVTGVDISASMLEEARRRHPDIRFEVGAAEGAPDRDAVGLRALRCLRPRVRLGVEDLGEAGGRGARVLVLEARPLLGDLEHGKADGTDTDKQDKANP